MQILNSASLDSDATAKSTGERGFKALSLQLGVSYLTNTTLEGRGETIEVSPASTKIRSDALPSIDETIVIYFDNLGRFEGRVIAAEEETFTVSFAGRRSKICRLADALTWAVNAAEFENEKRLNERHAENSATTATLADGSECECTVTDISVSGASIAISPKPEIGTILKIGKISGRVARHHEHGIGIIFATPSDIDTTRRAIRKC